MSLPPPPRPRRPTPAGPPAPRRTAQASGHSGTTGQASGQGGASSYARGAAHPQGEGPEDTPSHPRQARHRRTPRQNEAHQNTPGHHAPSSEEHTRGVRPEQRSTAHLGQGTREQYQTQPHPGHRTAEQPAQTRSSRTHLADTQQGTASDKTAQHPHPAQSPSETPKEGTVASSTKSPLVSRAMRSLRRPTGQHVAADLLGSHPADSRDSSVHRIDELIRARRRGYLHTAGVLTSVSTVVAVLVWLVFFSAIFAVDSQRISVTGGNESYTNEQAAQVLAAHTGTPLTRLSMSALSEELSNVPQVKEAHVSRVWPAGLSAILIMRNPALVEKTGDGHQILDSEGVVLGPAQGPTPGLPLVTLPTDEAHRKAALEDLTIVWEAVPHGLRTNIAQWRFDAHLVFFTFTDGREVRWGTSADSELKGKVLGLLVEQRFAKVYDVSSPASPVTSER